jgi:hypothetical protein
MGGFFQQGAEAVNLLSGNQLQTSSPDNALLSALQDFSRFQNTIGGKGDQVVESIQKEKQAKQKAQLGEGLVNQIALQPSADQKSVSLKIPQQHLDLLQGVQGQGPESVREMSNFLNKASTNEDLKKQLPNLVNEYSSKGLLTPTERMIIMSQASSDPEGAINRAVSIANNARMQTNQSAAASAQAVGNEISTLKSDPAVQQSNQEAKVAQIISTYTPDQLSSIDLSDASTYPGLSRPEAALAQDFLKRGAEKGIKPRASWLDSPQNMLSQATEGLVPPAAKVVSPQDLASQTSLKAPEAERLKALQKQQQDLNQQKANTQFRGPKPKVKGSDPAANMITIQDSQGGFHRIPKENLEKARKRDPKLIVVQ